jgi:hypothetical protein
MPTPTPTPAPYEMHLSDLGWIGFGLVLFLLFATAPAWGPDVLTWARRLVAARRVARYIQPSVKDFRKSEREKGAGVMASRGQTTPGRQTDEPDRRASAVLSGHDKLWGDFLLDRTRARLIAIMIDSQISVAEIRSLLKGDNTVISQEVADARKSLGLAPPAEYRTPIAGRPSQAEFESPPARSTFRETDPELAFHPPE